MTKKHLTTTIKLVAFSVATSILWTSCAKNPTEDITINNGETLAVNNSNEDLSLSNDAFVPNELLIKFKVGVSSTDKEKALLKINGKVKEKVLAEKITLDGTKKKAGAIGHVGATSFFPSKID